MSARVREASHSRKHHCVVSSPGSSTLTCAECRNCPDGWTGTETCNGVACFVSVYYTIGNTVNTQVDRGCYFNQQIIIHRCSNTIQETDGTLGQSVCCNESDFCNENTTLNFSYVTTSASAPPTSAPTATPTGRH